MLLWPFICLHVWIHFMDFNGFIESITPEKCVTTEQQMSGRCCMMAHVFQHAKLADVHICNIMSFVQMMWRDELCFTKVDQWIWI